MYIQDRALFGVFYVLILGKIMKIGQTTSDIMVHKSAEQEALSQ